jgi:hypothetical protein
MKKADEKIERIKETFLIPSEVDRVIEELPARIKLDTGAKITKTDLIVELLKLLQGVKINTRQVHSVDDIMEQVKESIRKGK